MDPVTVIIVLAAHLICTGGLLYLASRQMPPRCGLGAWALGLCTFGSAYLVRLAAGAEYSSAWSVVPDVAMLGASLLFIVGLRDFIGRQRLGGRAVAGGLLLFALVESLVIARWGAHGRHTALNLGLGFVYLWLAFNAAAARRHSDATLRRPLAFLTGLMGLLAMFTLARSLNIGLNGTAAVLGGVFARVYYAYASMAAVLLAMSLLWMVFVRLNGQLAVLATHDALTRVLNRAGLDEALRRHFGARPQPPMTLLAIDLDHFKRLNDEHGHLAGDRMLRAVGETLTRHLRPNDLVARLGGEEFVVCTASADRDAVLALAERLRAAIAAIELPFGAARLRCTASIGLSTPCTEAAGWDAAYAAADRALYAAKSQGRDRVQAA